MGRRNAPSLNESAYAVHFPRHGQSRSAGRHSFVRQPFYISSWAYSFPIAAIVIATFTISALTGLTLYTGVALLLLGILSLLIAFLTVRTLLAVRAGTICQPE